MYKKQENVTVYTSLLLFTLNVYGLNFPKKSHRLAE